MDSRRERKLLQSPGHPCLGCFVENIQTSPLLEEQAVKRGDHNLPFGQLVNAKPQKTGFNIFANTRGRFPSETNDHFWKRLWMEWKDMPDDEKRRWKMQSKMVKEDLIPRGLWQWFRKRANILNNLKIQIEALGGHFTFEIGLNGEVFRSLPADPTDSARVSSGCSGSTCTCVNAGCQEKSLVNYRGESDPMVCVKVESEDKTFLIPLEPKLYHDNVEGKTDICTTSVKVEVADYECGIPVANHDNVQVTPGVLGETDAFTTIIKTEDNALAVLSQPHKVKDLPSSLAEKQLSSKRAKWSSEVLATAISAVRQKSLGLRAAARQFGIPTSTLKNHIDGKNKYAKEGKRHFGRPPVLPPTVEKELVEYIINSEALFFGLTRKNVMSLAFEVAERNGLQNVFNIKKKTAGKVWLRLFLKRHPEISLRVSQAKGPIVSMQ